MLGVLVLLAVLAGVVIALKTANDVLFGGSSQPGAPVTVTIPEGAGVNGIADRLERAGVVGSALKFEFYVGSHGEGTSFKAGTYRLRRHESYARIVAILDAGPPAAQVKRLTVPEGYAVRDTAVEVEHRLGLPAKSYEAAARSATPPAGFLAKGEANPGNEGFLFPATYDVRVPVDAKALVGQQLGAFADAFSKVDLGYARSRRLTRLDVLKIASLIEREAAAPQDRAKIAAVVYNRLRRRMPLGIDATIQYAVGAWRPLTAADLRIPGPYNSRTHRGLPPTPICNPGAASLEAAAHPARVGYLYYVAIPRDPQRRHFFTDSYAAFVAYQKAHPA